MSDLVRTVRTDSLDERDWAHVVDVMPGLRRSVDLLVDVSHTGEGLAADTHAALLRDVVKLRDDVPPRWMVNRRVIEEILNADAYVDLHSASMGDPVNAGAGVMSLTPRLVELCSKVRQAQEKANEAQDAQDRLDQARNDQGDQGSGRAGQGSGDDETGSPAELIEQLEAEAKAAREAAEQALDEATPRIVSHVRHAVAQAAEDLADMQAAASAWGLDPGTAQRMDPAERFELMRRFDNPRLREAAKMFGRFEALRLGVRDRKFERLPDEIHDVVLGDDISHLVPAELMTLAVPELEDVFTLRLLERQARVYELRGTDKSGMGAIVYLCDSSGSMGPARSAYATGLGMALCAMAREQGRAFHAIQFQGPGMWQRFDFPAGEFNAATLIDFASYQGGGGTDVQGPFDEAIRILEHEHLNDGVVEGDIVVVTDDEFNVAPDWLTRFLDDVDRLAISVFGIALAGSTRSLAKVCDWVAHAGDLTDPSATSTIFNKISRY